MTATQVLTALGWMAVSAGVTPSPLVVELVRGRPAPSPRSVEPAPVPQPDDTPVHAPARS